MTRFIRQCLWAILLVDCTLFLAAPAQAGPVTCTATMTNLAFGSVNPQSSLTTANATLSYTCTNGSNAPHQIAACFAIGTGPQDLDQTNRRTIAGAGQYLQFQLYQDAAFTTPWGSSFNNSPPQALSVQVTVPASATFSGSATLYGRVPSGQTTAAPGNYQETLTNNTLNVVEGGNNFPANCSGGTTSGSNFAAFQVTAGVSNSCTVTAGPASDINLGTVPATAVNISGNNNISVTCPTGTAYYIGLSPSNGSTTGAGTMTYGSSVPVPYQLYQDAGLTTIWGNTATAASAGNGKAGTGTGAAQSIPVYARAPSADYQPGTYSDTVTVTVNY